MFFHHETDDYNSFLMFFLTPNRTNGYCILLIRVITKPMVTGHRGGVEVEVEESGNQAPLAAGVGQAWERCVVDSHQGSAENAQHWHLGARA